MTFWETVANGEYVMIALAVLFIGAACLWWIRWSVLNRQNKSYLRILPRIEDYVVEGDIENTKQLCAATATPGARIAEAGINSLGEPLEGVRSAMQTVAETEKNNLSIGLRWLKAFAVIAPLLGLGGNLVGIIDRLRDLGESELPVEISTVCEAIAPTIVTTVAGLGVGIFALIAFTCLEGSVDKAQRNLDNIVIRIIDLLNRPS